MAKLDLHKKHYGYPQCYVATGVTKLSTSKFSTRFPLHVILACDSAEDIFWLASVICEIKKKER